ncbi:NADPH-dependent FMN reductase [Actinoalloteichus caeruleus]|uniref:NADPH-dependent FMN reductase n=2 Tax=Actinoalloteichus cyanogriseus TaxID=2893586 RepID=UPI0004C14D73|nr:NAD(P)H-dependent oxidoreductase [Actinoalloteichus caeruleus]
MSHSPAPYRLAVLMGSVREGRFCPTVTRWFVGQAVNRSDIATVDVIDPAELNLEDEEFAKRIEAADAIVVVTPEYNHGYPGALKSAIDSLFAEWQTKPVGFVSYGGISGGLRAVEQLRAVFAELHAVTIRETVSFHGADARFDAKGNPLDADRVNRAASALLNQLGWWAETLRDGRAARAYV